MSPKLDVTVLSRRAVSAADCPRALQTTTDDRRQTADDADRRRRAKQYWQIRQASNKPTVKKILVSIYNNSLWEQQQQCWKGNWPIYMMCLETMMFTMLTRISVTFKARSSAVRVHERVVPATLSFRRPHGAIRLQRCKVVTVCSWHLHTVFAFIHWQNVETEASLF